MKKIIASTVLLFTLLISTSQRAVAQDFTYGVKAGLNISGLTRTSFSQSRVRGNVGVMAGYQLSDILGLQGEVLYSWQGVKYTNSSEKWSLNYLKIPILAKLYLIGGLNFEAGISFNILITGKHLNIPLYNISAGMIDEVRGFDFSFPIGVNYAFARHYEVGLRYDISTVRVPVFKLNRATNSNFSINFTYKF